MEVEGIKQVFSLIAVALGLMKQTKDLLPESENKDIISANIEQAEKQMKIAEAQIAQSMGYKLCKNHFPPEIMLSADNKNWHCPFCDNKITPKVSEHPTKGIKSL